MSTYHDIKEIKLHGNLLEATIDGTTRSFQLTKISSLLAEASELERATFEVSPSGYGIHWPLLDEDISFDALLGRVHAPVKRRKIA